MDTGGVHPGQQGNRRPQATGWLSADPEEIHQPPWGPWGAGPPAPACPTIRLVCTQTGLLGAYRLWHRPKKKKKNPHVLILIWGMKVYIKQLLSGSSNSLYLQGFLFHSAGKFLLTIIAFEEPAGLGRVVGSFTSCLPVGGTEPGPA